MGRRSCAIYGCGSNSVDNKDLKFFYFPTKGSQLFLTWLALCKASAEFIAAQRSPVICSRHFYEHDIDQNDLSKNALPSLFLFAPTGLKPTVLNEEEIASLHKGENLRTAETKRIATDTVQEVGTRCKKHKASADHSGDDLEEDSSSSNVKVEINDSTELSLNDGDKANQSTSDETATIEVKSERNDDCIELSIKDEVDTANDVEDRQTDTKDEIVAIEVKSENNDDWIELSIKDEADAANDIEDKQTDAKDEIVIESYQQALELLDSLEDYALRTERYKAFGLLMTLETIFKNPKSDTDP